MKKFAECVGALDRFERAESYQKRQAMEKSPFEEMGKAEKKKKNGNNKRFNIKSGFENDQMDYENLWREFVISESTNHPYLYGYYRDHGE